MAGFASIADRLRVSAPALLLDAGCGWGGPGLWIAQRLGCALRGIDFSAAAVGHATRRAEPMGVDALFTVGILEETGVPDGLADAVVSVDAFHFAPDPLAAGLELLRSTKPGSRMVATLWLPLPVRND